MNQIISRFLKGASAPYQGFKSLYSGPKIWWLAIIPALVSSGLFLFGLFAGIGYMEPWLALVIPAAVGFWSTLFNWIMTVVGYILFAILLVLIVFVVSKIVVIPFNAFIAEKVLKHHGVLQSKNVSMGEWLGRTFRMLLITLIQLAFFLVLGVALFILSFIPVLSILAAYVGFLIVAFDCSDYALEIAELGLKEKLSLMKRRLPEFSGFAAVLGLTFLVPLLNFFLLPIAVSGASWLVSSFDEVWKNQKV